VVAYSKIINGAALVLPDMNQRERILLPMSARAPSRLSLCRHGVGRPRPRQLSALEP
jgi:hypothetical protein